MNNSVESFDYEIKFVGENHKAYLLENYLQKSFAPDSEFPEAIISSVYYDTMKLDLLNEKINSDYEKTKIRYRSYLNPQTGERSKVSFKEIKHKLGDKRYKIRKQVQTKKSIFEDFLLAGSSIEMNEFRAEFTNLRTPIEPMFTIQYHRKRFVTQREKIRICLDQKIHVGQYNQRVFNYKKNNVSKYCVFEIKGRFKEFPLELKILENFNFKLDSFSKYLVCSEELLVPLRGV
ncbi:VTC domain-containing protein [Bacteriovoracaceae bacterium]|nr:VTC domain-containing protein [Bacteriovoracaceae bacterium]